MGYSSPTRILSIYFSYDEKGNNEMNFNLKVNKMQTNLDIWRSRDLTFFGKVIRAATIHFLSNRYISRYKCHDTIHDTIHHNIQLTSDVM